VRLAGLITPNAKVANKNMSGLDGLGWPNHEDEPKPTKSMNDTPETDATIRRYTVTYGMIGKYVRADFARKLERERDEARGQIEANHKAALVIERMVYEAREQRDAAMQCHEWCRKDRKRIIKELTTVTAQRDRLAEALRKLADCDLVITLPNRMDAVRTIARETLQSLT
jgi:hypothetical protein